MFNWNAEHASGKMDAAFRDEFFAGRIPNFNFGKEGLNMNKAFFALCCFLLGSGTAIRASDAKPFPTPPILPAWAFEQIVWEDEVNTQEGAIRLVEGYLARGIPVGGVIIDSPWSEAYTDFTWDAKRYPDPESMIRRFRSQGVRTILWTTGAINLTGKDSQKQKCATYDEVVEKGYAINDGKPGEWWKGKGVHLDFTNKDAAAWWRRQLDKAFTEGVDGWKVDQAEFWFGDELKTSIGTLSNAEFRPYYYDAMFDYVMARRKDGITIARPFSHQGGDAASIDKVSLGWCGDFSGDWAGLQLQIRNIYESAKRGYGALACEVGGFFMARPNKKQLVRYAQFGCMTACMINGGENGAFSNHLPWHHGKDAEEIYRFCTILHNELIPYLFSSVADSHRNGGSLLKDVSFEEESHRLGNDVFTKAVSAEDDAVKFHLPSGEDVWIDFWSGERLPGGHFEEKVFPLDRFPLYFRAGSIIPLRIAERNSVFGDSTMTGKRVLLIHPRGNGKSSVVLHLPVGDGIEYEDCFVSFDEDAGELRIRSASPAQCVLIFRNARKMEKIEGASSFRRNAETGDLIVEAEGDEILLNLHPAD